MFHGNVWDDSICRPLSVFRMHQHGRRLQQGDIHYCMTAVCYADSTSKVFFLFFFVLPLLLCTEWSVVQKEASVTSRRAGQRQDGWLAICRVVLHGHRLREWRERRD